MSVVLALAAGVLATEPAMFRGGPAHSGIYASPSAPSLASTKWKFKTGGRVFSSPVVAGGVVYVGSLDHYLYALDATTGAVRWKFATHGPVTSSPAVAGNRVYVNSVDGSFYAVDAAAGKMAWKFTTGGERRFTAPGMHGIQPPTEMVADPFDVFTSSPALSGSMVYFGSGDHFVYALEASSGKLVWKFETGNVVHASPAVADGVVYIGSWDRNLYALDATSGKQLWKYQTGEDTKIYNQTGIASSAAVADGTVFFGCRDGHLYAVNAKTGEQKWSHDNKGGWVIASPAVRDGVVYFPTSDGQRFKALDAATGAVVFNIENNAISFSSPALVNDTIYYGSSDGWLHAIDAKTGARKADFQTDGSKENAAKYIDAKGHMNSRALYSDFTLEAVIVGLDRMYSLGSILSSPVVADGVLYTGSTDGNVYALN